MTGMEQVDETLALQGQGRRKAMLPSYRDVVYKNNTYVVAKKGSYTFVFDKDDFEEIRKLNWYKLSSNYIASNVAGNTTQKQLLLHNFIMNPSADPAHIVVHVSSNPLDNRRENLRIIPANEKYILQKKKRTRSSKLPENSGINPYDIPRHISYIKPNGLHGDRFAIELKTENYFWKSPSSKKMPLIEKLNQAKDRLNELYTLHPYLNLSDDTKIQQMNQLSDSFNEIVNLVTE